MLVLDVGCGDRPRGNVNCDLFMGYTPHTTKKRIRYINPKTIPNFVKCSANFLPFKDKSFHISYCFDVLEHKGVNFSKAFFELVRVTQRTVKFRVPHRFYRESKFHWSCKWHANRPFSVLSIEKWLKKNGFNPIINVSWKYYPRSILCLIRFPNAITVTLNLR